MRKVILTRGLPASGKSTWAQKMIDDYPNKYKLVCKDDLRDMLDNHRRSDNIKNQKVFQKREKFVLKVRDFIIRESLQGGYSVIVADTNLSTKHEARIRDLVRQHNKETGDSVSVQVEDFTDVSLEECIRRDLKREDSVGEGAIRQMHQQFLAQQPETMPVVKVCPENLESLQAKLLAGDDLLFTKLASIIDNSKSDVEKASLALEVLSTLGSQYSSNVDQVFRNVFTSAPPYLMHSAISSLWNLSPNRRRKFISVIKQIALLGIEASQFLELHRGAD